MRDLFTITNLLLRSISSTGELKQLETVVKLQVLTISSVLNASMDSFSQLMENHALDK